MSPMERSQGRLLVVDDDLVQRTILGKIGTRLGFDTVIASTFEIASELLRTQSFDIMTLDLSLGERDGAELLGLIAELKLNAMPIVVVSGAEGHVLHATKRLGQALELTLTHCLTKPLNLDDVREALLLSSPKQTVPAAAAAMPVIDRERLVTALAGGEFFTEFQLKIDLKTGKAIGAEAMARWRTPEFGMVPPTTFIPLVEQFGLMPDLNNHVVASAIADSRRLISQHPGFTVAVDLSGSRLADPTLPERIEDILREQGVAPESLIVEITERVAMSNIDMAMDILVRLRKRGFGTAIADFGTGYATLAALARLPLSELQIDQTFVAGCETNEDMMKIVNASIGLAKAFKMKVVAQGIDSPHTLARLRQAGCDIGQGNLFAPGMRSERAERWMTQRESQTGAGSLFEQPRQLAPQAAR